jgi:hypothetical protein
VNDLRESLNPMLDSEPPMPDIIGDVIATGKRALRQRRIAVGAVTAGAGVVVATAVAVPLVPGSGSHPQSLRIAATASASPTAAVTPSAAASAAGFGLNASGQAPTCPAGELPTVSADLSTVVVHGTYGPGDQSWADQYAKPDPTLRAVGFSVAAVNGASPSPATSYLWVLSGPNDSERYAASVLLVRTSGSTWEGHPATFTGCRPVVG